MYNPSMARWKPDRLRKKGPEPINKGRLIGCLLALAGVLVVFYLLFSALLGR